MGSLQRESQALSSQVLVGVGREHRNVSLTPLPNSSCTISQNINELGIKTFRVNNFLSHQCMKIEYRSLLTLYFQGIGDFQETENLEVEELQLQIFS